MGVGRVKTSFKKLFFLPFLSRSIPKTLVSLTSLSINLSLRNGFFFNITHLMLLAVFPNAAESGFSYSFNIVFFFILVNSLFDIFFDAFIFFKSVLPCFLTPNPVNSSITFPSFAFSWVFQILCLFSLFTPTSVFMSTGDLSSIFDLNFLGYNSCVSSFLFRFFVFSWTFAV